MPSRHLKTKGRSTSFRDNEGIKKKTGMCNTLQSSLRKGDLRTPDLSLKNNRRQGGSTDSMRSENVAGK